MQTQALLYQRKKIMAEREYRELRMIAAGKNSAAFKSLSVEVVNTLFDNDDERRAIELEALFR